jgi:hypothetical protein
VKKKTLHIISIFFTAVIAVPILLIVLLQIFQLQIKYQAKESLEKEFLQRITIPLKTVQWMEKDKEVIVNGRMFDVESYHIKNGYITLKGIYDDVETNIIQLLNKQSDRSQQTTSIIQLLLLIQCFIASVYLADYLKKIIMGLTKNYFFLLLRYLNPYSLILTPPPRL